MGVDVGMKVVCGQAKMEARAGQRAVTQRRQGRAVAGLLDAGPRQTGIEIVTTVHIDRAGLDHLADALGGIDVFGPDGRGKAITAVVHQRDRLFFVADLGDADDGAETLFNMTVMV